MSDKDMISKAFASLKAPDDTLERIHEKMNHEKNQKGNLRHKRLTLVLAAVLVLALGTAGVYAAGGFQLGKIFARGNILDSDGSVVLEQDGADAADDSSAGGFVISAPFAAENPVTHVHHDGIDFIADAGTPVLAAAAGEVVTADFDPKYGYHVIIQHEGGYTTLYAHLAELRVAAGDTAEAGTEIGTVGNTGQSTGPHLHLELRKDGQPVDPADYWAEN